MTFDPESEKNISKKMEIEMLGAGAITISGAVATFYTGIGAYFNPELIKYPVAILGLTVLGLVYWGSRMRYLGRLGK